MDKDSDSLADTKFDDDETTCITFHHIPFLIKNIILYYILLYIYFILRMIFWNTLKVTASSKIKTLKLFVTCKFCNLRNWFKEKKRTKYK